MYPLVPTGTHWYSDTTGTGSGGTGDTRGPRGNENIALVWSKSAVLPTSLMPFFLSEVYGAFGCSTTAVFSDIVDLSKNRCFEKIPIDPHLQFLNGLVIFHTAQGTQAMWKIGGDSGILPTYIEVHKKVLSDISNVKVFTVDPYFEVVFSPDSQKGLNFRHFRHF